MSHVSLQMFSPSNLLGDAYESSYPDGFSSRAREVRSDEALSLALPSSLVERIGFDYVTFEVLQLGGTLCFLFGLSSVTGFTGALMPLSIPSSKGESYGANEILLVVTLTGSALVYLTALHGEK